DSSDHIWIEDNEEESAIDNASTFIILFFLSIFYRAAVTLVKVK
nr:immunoglobulin heavy chain [Heterodontus, Peptide, 43 aa] [Heterodontus]